MSMKYIILGILCFQFTNSTGQTTPGKTFHLTGLIGNKTKASITITESDSVLIGSITYTSTNRPIFLRGKILDNSQYRLLEFDKKGAISGIIMCSIRGKLLEGTWYSPINKKELKILMNLQSKKPKNVSSARINPTGNYSFNYGKDGPTGWLGIERVGKDSLEIQFNNVTGGPGYSEATVEPVKLPILNNKVYYQHSPGCSIRIRFIADIALVDYENEQRECSFGLNASLEGIYLKEKTTHK